MHSNIYIVCSHRTRLAITLIYISLLPMYGIISICSTSLPLYCHLYTHYIDNARLLYICTIYTRYIITICNVDNCHLTTAVVIINAAKIRRKLLHTKEKKLINVNREVKKCKTLRTDTITKALTIFNAKNLQNQNPVSEPLFSAGWYIVP